MDEREGTQDLPGDDDWAKALLDQSWLAGGPHEASHEERLVHAERARASFRAEKLHAEKTAAKAAARRYNFRTDKGSRLSAAVAVGLIVLAIGSYVLNRPHASHTSVPSISGDLAASATCLSNTTELPVPCSTPHGPEVTGVVDVGAAVSTEPATLGQWQQLVGPTCNNFGLAYVGGTYPAGVSSGLIPIAPSSWAAGSRSVQCVVGKTVAGGSWATVTGSLRKA